jgi:hypothetical protein
MTTLILLVTYVLIGCLFIATAVPLVQGRVKPNPWYGFRVRKTLENLEIWYAVNAYFGRRFAVAGLLIAAAAIVTAGSSALADAPKPDSGKFSLRLQGKELGVDTYRLLPDGCDADVSLDMGGQARQFHQTLKFKKGVWTELSIDAGAAGTMKIALSGAKGSLKLGDKPATAQKLPATAYPYGDRCPHLLAFLVSAYDTKRGGEQKFDLIYTESPGPDKNVLILPAVLKDPVTAARQVGGRSVQVTRYPLTINGKAGPIAMDILTDKEKHILLWNVPVQRYSGVREGFEDLAK